MTSSTTTALPTRSLRSRLPRALPRVISERLATRDGMAAAAAVGASRSEASLAHYDALLTAEARMCDVPVDLLQAICWFASGWRQFDIGGRVLSTPTPHGTCWGAMQLSDEWHPDAFPAACDDARANIAYAASLVRWLFEQTGDWNRATIAFFGHDRRAEAAGRRIAAYRRNRPWVDRMAPVVDAPDAAPLPEVAQIAPAAPTGAPAVIHAPAAAPAAPEGSLYDDLDGWNDLAAASDLAADDLDTSSLYDDLAI